MWYPSLLNIIRSDYANLKHARSYLIPEMPEEIQHEEKGQNNLCASLWELLNPYAAVG